VAETKSAYADIEGGPELLAWFGGEPHFHDAEIISLNLQRRGESMLDIHFWTSTGAVDHRGYFILDNHVVVTFVLKGVADLELDGFNHQNVIYSLSFHRAYDRPDRAPYAIGSSPEDYEIELEDCYGMGGRIRCQQVSIRLTPGKPIDAKGYWPDMP
jgi:hypothetical protein